MKRIILLITVLTFYVVIVCFVAIRLNWQSDIIGGLLTVPIEVVFIAAIVEVYREIREKRQWSSTREIIVDQSKALINEFLYGIDQLSIIYEPSNLEVKMEDESTKDEYLTYCLNIPQLLGDHWNKAFESWLQSMQLSAHCFSSGMSKNIIKLNDCFEIFKLLHKYFLAIASGSEKSHRIGMVSTVLEDRIYENCKKFNSLFKFFGSESKYTPELSAAILAWEEATNIVIKMYQELGYKISKKGIEKSDIYEIILSRDDNKQNFMTYKKGFELTLVEIDESLRMLSSNE